METQHRSVLSSSVGLACAGLASMILMACNRPHQATSFGEMPSAPKTSLQGISPDRKLGLEYYSGLSHRAAREVTAEEYNKAEADYLAIIRAQPKNPFLYANLAKLYEKEGRGKEAYKAWSRVLEGAPGAVSSMQYDPAVLAHYGELAMKYGNRTKELLIIAPLFLSDTS